VDYLCGFAQGRPLAVKLKMWGKKMKEWYRKYGKRILDIVVSAVALIVLLPLALIIAAVIRIEMGSPVIFRQVRLGLHGKPFVIYKFRTMEVGAEQQGLLITSADDLRVTRVGKLLRKLKLDEIPQFINVLKGEMSLVGPRPEVPRYVALYSDEQKRKILSIKPGMTDPATVYFRNEEQLLAQVDDKENFYINEIMPVKLTLYLQYTEKMSMLYDIKLIFLQVLALILPPAVFCRIFSKNIKA